MQRKVCAVSAKVDDKQISLVHNEHHLGIDRTVYFAKRKFGCEVDRNLVEKVVKDCHICRSVDPSPVKWDHGQLSVPNVWQRLAADITHVTGRPFLTLIDCGPSIYSLWIRLPNETAETVTKQLERVF